MTHHGACLRAELIAEGVAPEDAEHIVADVRSGRTPQRLADSDRAIVRYTLKLTRVPQEMHESDVRELREHGFTDRAVYDIVGIAGFFAYVNRVAEGLGVPLEAEWERLLEATTRARAVLRGIPEG